MRHPEILIPESELAAVRIRFRRERQEILDALAASGVDDPKTWLDEGYDTEKYKIVCGLLRQRAARQLLPQPRSEDGI